MSSSVQISMALLLASLLGGCVYVPADYYYRTAEPVDYYVEDYPGAGPWWDEPLPPRHRRSDHYHHRRSRRHLERYEDREAYREPRHKDRPGRTHEDDARTPDPEPLPKLDSPSEPSTPPVTQEQKQQAPVGKRTSNPDRVKSPYPPFNELDVSGMASGSLAKDPTTGKIFRVP